jgi:hypothetical protein
MMLDAAMLITFGVGAIAAAREVGADSDTDHGTPEPG